MDLKSFFREHNKAAIAFSGGVDSAYLLYCAVSENTDVTAYYVKSAFQPQFELEDAIRLAKELGARLSIIDVDVLENETIASNPSDRCYYCKRVIFESIIKEAKKDGYDILLDGTNASDDEGDRPGVRALKELKVLSPLRICGLTKNRIRELSKEAGLFTWNKPAYACLATRIPTGETITADKLKKTEAAEGFMTKLGFSDFRVRTFENKARLEVKEEQLSLVLLHREVIIKELKQYYTDVYLNLEVRK